MSACRNSAVGAEIACKVSADIILDHVEYYFASDSQKVKRIILENIKREIQKQAEKDFLYPEDYASTLCFVCCNKINGQALMFSLGDSRIYLIEDGRAEYVNQTLSHGKNRVCSTISFEAEWEASVEKIELDFDASFLLCTDGMWKTAEKKNLPELLHSTGSGTNLMKYLETEEIVDDCSFLLTG